MEYSRFLFVFYFLWMMGACMQSFVVVYKGSAVEFAIDCSVEDVRNYFLVQGGGLKEDGLGPVVYKVKEGSVYELVGATKVSVSDLFSKLQQKEKSTNASGEESKDDTTQSKKVIDTQSPPSPVSSHRPITLNEDEIAEKMVRRNYQGLVNWAIVATASVAILISLVATFVLGSYYKFEEQLKLPLEQMDNMNEIKVGALLCVVLFSALAMFHRENDFSTVKIKQD